MKSNILDLDVIFVHSTDAAILVRFEEDENFSKEAWLPKSLVEADESQFVPGKPIEISLPEYIAKEKGMI